MPTYVDVLKFEGEAPVNTLRLIASGGIHRVGGPFARYGGIVHAAVVSRFSHGFTAHRLATRKTIAARGAMGQVNFTAAAIRLSCAKEPAAPAAGAAPAGRGPVAPMRRMVLPGEETRAVKFYCP